MNTPISLLGRRCVVFLAVSFSVSVAALAGCGGGHRMVSGTGGTGGGSGGSGVCAPGAGTGTLALRISGTPRGDGMVTLAAGTTLTVSSDVTLPAGPESVTGYLVAEGSSLVRTAYTPTVDVPTPCVRAGQTTTVNVTYSAIASSGLVWLGVSNVATSATMLGYDPADVSATGSAVAAVATNTHGSDGFTFDPYGNAWVTGATTADAPIARYSAGTMGSDGNKTPDVIIDSPSFGSAIPGPKVLAFDMQGNLWVSVVASDKVVGFTAAQIAASGNRVASVEQSGIGAPAGIAFDAAGNMWVAANGDSTVVRIDAAHVGSSGIGGDLVISAQTPAPVIGLLSSPLGIAFDAAGNLWVNYDGVLARLTPTDQAGAGTKTVTPSVQITLDALSLPYGIAFDEAGGLWYADRTGQFACLRAGQLTTSGTKTPEIMIASPDLGSAGWFALYPAPAFTPLAHALP